MMLSGIRLFSIHLLRAARLGYGAIACRGDCLVGQLLELNLPRVGRSSSKNVRDRILRP